MARRTLSLFLLILPLFFSSCGVEEQRSETTHRVLVSIAPYRSFVKRLMDDQIEVDLVVPAGANSHSYEPTPRQVSIAASADLWFRVGEEFEEPLENALGGRENSPRVVDLRNGISLLGDPSDPDPHVWLSPRRLSDQVELIAAELIKVYPERKERIESNLSLLIDDLNTLDLRLATIIDFAEVRTILVAHPAYAYFCEDYGLEQLSIERHGSEPGAHAVTEVIEKARRAKIRRVFVQPQHSSKGATQIARTLDAEIIDLDPVDEDYFDNMRKIAWKFAGY